MSLRPLALSLVVGVQLWTASQGVVVRSQKAESGLLVNSSAIPTNAEIKEKWDKMGEFMEIMFIMACKWKHGKDVHGAAVAKGKSGDFVDQKQVVAFKEELRSKNVRQLANACGSIVGSGKGKCRQSCGDRWGQLMGKRSACDGKCVAVYKAFESGCRSKAANLEKVYAMKVQMATSRERCYEGHCGKIPTVWMKADAAAMNSEVTKQCDNQCTEKRIKTRCDQKWQLEVDFVRGDIENKCFEESTVVSCFDTEKGTISTDYDTCVSKDKGTCDTQFDECKTKGKADANFKSAKEFCEKRKEMCVEQVDKSCLKENKEALDKAKAKCEKEGKDGEDKCVDEKMTAKETEVVDKCKTDLPPKCKADCKKSCEVDKMQSCLSNLSDDDPSEAFCTDFWHLLHESGEVDPMTGDPIVLLSQKQH